MECKLDGIFLEGSSKKSKAQRWLVWFLFTGICFLSFSKTIFAVSVDTMADEDAYVREWLPTSAGNTSYLYTSPGSYDDGSGGAAGGVVIQFDLPYSSAYAITSVLNGAKIRLTSCGITEGTTFRITVW